jgi:hypothetical protein
VPDQQARGPLAERPPATGDALPPNGVSVAGGGVAPGASGDAADVVNGTVKGIASGGVARLAERFAPEPAEEHSGAVTGDEVTVDDVAVRTGSADTVVSDEHGDDAADVAQGSDDSGVPDGLEVADDVEVTNGAEVAGDVELDVDGGEGDAGAAPAASAESGREPELPPLPVDPIAAAVDGWRRALAGSHASDTLLARTPDATASWLDLTQAHPSGLAQLFAARPTRLSSLFRESAAHATARRRVRTIRASAMLLAAQRGIHGCCLAIGMASWRPAAGSNPWDVRVPTPVLAPVVLRGCRVGPRGAGHEDYDLDLDDTVVVNPELLRELAETYGVESDGAYLATLAHGPKGFDPRPVYAWLEERCGALPGFKIERTLVLATFSAGSGAVLADLDAAVPAIAAHPLLSAATAEAAPVTLVLPSDDDPVAAAAPGEARVAPSVEPAPAGPPAGGESRRLAVVGRLGPRGAARPMRPPPETDPRDELLVLDLDPAQQAAVMAAMRGDDVVIEGPPGTGTTHALAATIAALAAAGRRVLVVGPRRASVEALLARLDAAGISDLVLDLQDAAGGRTSTAFVSATSAIRTAMQAAQRRRTTLLPTGLLPAVARDPAPAEPAAPGAPGESGPAGTAVAVPERVHAISTVAARAGTPGVERDEPATVLRAARRVLDGAVSALHQPRAPWQLSAYDAMVAIAELGGRPSPPRTGVRLPEDVLLQLDAVTRERLRIHLHAAAAAGAFTLSRVETRWYDAAVTTGAEARAALDAALALRANLERARGAMEAVTADAGLRRSPDAAGWRPLLDIMLRVRATVDVMDPAVYEQPLEELVSATAPRGVRGDDGRTRRERRQVRRQAQALVRPGIHLANLHGVLRGAQAQLARWEELSVTAEGPRVVVGLSDAAASVDLVTRALDVLAAVFEGTDTPDPRTMPLDDLERRVWDLAGDAKSILGQPRRATLITGLREAGLGELVDDLRARRVGPEAIDGELDLAWWSSVLDAMIRSDPRLSRHDAAAGRQASADLRASEAAYIYAGAGRVRTAVLARAGSVLAAEQEQLQALREELYRDDRSPRLPDLVRRAGDVLGALCPVWVMSPDTVAACLPPAQAGHEPPVDVVVVDDAEHVALPEVVAAMSRGRQVVVAGDRRRAAAPMGGPSVIAAVAPHAVVCKLDRDHRARDGRVLVPLAPQYPEGWQLTPGVAVAPPLRLETVADGVAVAPPGEELPISADAEVRRVVDLVAAHAARHPEETLVVVTFGERHAERIEEALRAEVAERPALSRWLAERWRDGLPEPFLVRPAQRLLGVERDAAIVTVGLARTPHGRVLHRFDVLDSASGAALLITAMSRARRRTTVVSCFTADDLVPDRLRSDGARLLRDVLLAAGGRGAASAGRSPSAVDGLVAELRDRLATAGLPVHARVGDGAWPLDIAVADPRVPGRMLVAVDLDGPAFASRPTRERERQRPERWERAGWTYCKVSALDLYRDAALEVQRIREAWERALVSDTHGRPRADDDDPVVPSRSDDDEDAGWGERSPDDEDNHLERERPPHWE